MALNTSSLDARIAEAIKALVAARNRLVSPDDRVADAAAALIARLAKLLVQPDARQRCLEAAALPAYSQSWRGYDDASPAMQELYDVYNSVTFGVRQGAASLLGHEDAASFLAAHPHDPAVWAAVEAGGDPRPVINRVLLRRAGQPQQVGGRQLTFLGGGSTVVVDGRFSYGPAAPEILATAGRQRGRERPRYIVQRAPTTSREPIAVDLDELRVTRFQRENVATHTPDIRSIDDHGVFIALRNGETRRWAWDDFLWRPLAPFET